MPEQPHNQRVVVHFVGSPPARQVARASGVTEVEVDGSLLRCLVCGSFQPFLEALHGYEVIGLTSIPVLSISEARDEPAQVQRLGGDGGGC
jgi:hypothetical protein